MIYLREKLEGSTLITFKWWQRTLHLIIYFFFDNLMIRPSIFVAGLLAGCASNVELDENAPEHHRQDGTLVNSNGEAIAKPLSALIKWQREAPDVTPLNLPSVPPQLDALADPTSAQVTWIGHSTFLLQVDGLNILTDPIFSERASPVSFAGPKRTTPPAMSVEQLPPIDIVLISHNHYDHLDKPSIKALQSKQPGNVCTPLSIVQSFISSGKCSDTRVIAYAKNARVGSVL